MGWIKLLIIFVALVGLSLQAEADSNTAEPNSDVTDQPDFLDDKGEVIEEVLLSDIDADEVPKVTQEKTEEKEAEEKAAEEKEAEEEAEVEADLEIETADVEAEDEEDEDDEEDAEDNENRRRRSLTFDDLDEEIETLFEQLRSSPIGASGRVRRAPSVEKTSEKELKEELNELENDVGELSEDKDADDVEESKEKMDQVSSDIMTSLQAMKSGEMKKVNKTGIAVLISVAVVILIFIIVMVKCICLKKKKAKTAAPLPEEQQPLDGGDRTLRRSSRRSFRSNP